MIYIHNIGQLIYNNSSRKILCKEFGILQKGKLLNSLYSYLVQTRLIQLHILTQNVLGNTKFPTWGEYRE